MIRIKAATATSDSAVLEADAAGGILTVAELRQLISREFIVEVEALIGDLESPIAKAERASERMLRLRERLGEAPDTERSSRP